jgi:anti-sigma factor RsiW
MSTVRPISEDDLHAYVDGALDAIRQAEVAAYLAEHPAMAARVDGFARQRAMLREALCPIAQEPLPPELSLRRMLDERPAPRKAPWHSAAAAIALLAAGGAGGWFGRDWWGHPAHGLAALTREASENYQVYGPDHFRPVEIKAGDARPLLDWISQRIGQPVIAPDLTASGYRFMGGRLVATAHGPAGLFMYDDDRGTRLVMLVRTMVQERSKAMSRYEDGGVAGFAWAQDGIGYSVVGGAKTETLHPIADELRRQLAGKRQRGRI